VTERQRVEHVVQQLTEALQRPLTSPGSVEVAVAALRQLSGASMAETLYTFAEKAVQTLRDGERHDTLALSPRSPHAAVWFVAWNGTHREVQPARVGAYLGELMGLAHRLTEDGFELAGFLEIDAYVRNGADADSSDSSLGPSIQVDIEYSFLPGVVLGMPPGIVSPLPSVFLVNQDLCTPDERQVLSQLMA
jgi:hypothetical protein